MRVLRIFSLKSVFNRLYRLSPNGHQLSDVEIKKLQKCLLCIYSDIYEVCKKYEIKPFLQGGTLLGKLRHNGFIPWDDDLDLGMSRACLLYTSAAFPVPARLPWFWPRIMRGGFMWWITTGFL